ncbi:MAG: hypothetical protein AAFY52_02085 [Pseudomonadota bacterium]
MPNVQAKLPPPCDAAETYVELLGEQTALAFILEFGGSEVFIPEKPRGKGMVEAIVGYEGMKALRHASFEASFRIPLANKWVAQCLHVQGHSINAIARRMRMTTNTVSKYIKALDDQCAK